MKITYQKTFKKITLLWDEKWWYSKKYTEVRSARSYILQVTVQITDCLDCLGMDSGHFQQFWEITFHKKECLPVENPITVYLLLFNLRMKIEVQHAVRHSNKGFVTLVFHTKNVCYSVLIPLKVCKWYFGTPCITEIVKLTTFHKYNKKFLDQISHFKQYLVSFLNYQEIMNRNTCWCTNIDNWQYSLLKKGRVYVRRESMLEKMTNTWNSWYLKKKEFFFLFSKKL